MSLLDAKAALAASGALPALDDPLGRALGALMDSGVFANVDFTAPTTTGLILVGAWLAPRRAAAVATLTLAAVWIGVTGIDLAEVSVPRLHEPPLLLALPLAAVALDRLLSMRQASAAMHRRVAWCLLIVVGLVQLAGSAWSAHRQLRPQGVDHEEALWRDAIEALPPGPGCLASIGYGDAIEVHKTPRHVPAYLLDAHRPGWTSFDLVHVPELLGGRCAGPVFALLGLRCYAALRERGEAAPAGAATVAACQAFRDRWLLQPVIEREVPNAGDLGYPLYPTAESLQVGLYQVVGTVADPP